MRLREAKRLVQGHKTRKGQRWACWWGVRPETGPPLTRWGPSLWLSGAHLRSAH